VNDAKKEALARLTQSYHDIHVATKTHRSNLKAAIEAGCHNTEIANAIGVSEAAVRMYRARMKKRKEL
jgi:FixJ family two-component response regulator